MKTKPTLLAPRLPDLPPEKKREKLNNLRKEALAHYSLQEVVYSPLGLYLSQNDVLFLSFVLEKALSEQNLPLFETLLSETSPLPTVKAARVAMMVTSATSSKNLTPQACDILINPKTAPLWQEVLSTNMLGAQLHMFKDNPVCFFEKLFEHIILPPKTLVAFLHQPPLSEKLMEKSPLYPNLLLNAFKEIFKSPSSQEKALNTMAHLPQTLSFLKSSLLKEQIQKSIPCVLSDPPSKKM